VFGDFEHDLIRCLESTFELGRRFWSTMRIDCGQLDPGAVIRPVPSEWDPRMPECLDEEELAAGASAHRTAAAHRASRTQTFQVWADICSIC